MASAKDRIEPLTARKSPVWWFVDANGRKIGYMWPEDMLAAIESIWGYRQGIGGFARYAGLHRVTIEQYCNGKRAIPKHIALMVTCLTQIMLEAKAHHKAHPWRSLPKVEADWLPLDPTAGSFKIEKLPNG